MPRLLRIGIKDLVVQVRDFPALAVMIGMPMVLILILGSALGGMSGNGGEFERVDVAIVDDDGSEVSGHVVDAFTESDELRELFRVTLPEDAEEARAAVERGDLAAALLVPEGFGDEVGRGRAVELQVLTDPGQSTFGAVFTGVVRSAAGRISAASVAAQTTAGLLAESRMVTSAEDVRRYVDEAAQAASSDDALSAVEVASAEAERDESGEFDALDYYAAGMSVMFLLFGAMFGAFSLVREKRDQTLARLLSTPTARWSIVGGKMAGVFVIGLVQFAALYAFTLAIGVDWGAAPLGVWLLVIGELAAVTALAVVLSAVARNERQVGAIGPVAIQILAALGGSFIPLEVFPAWLQPAHFLTPNGLALDGIQALRAGAAVTEVLPHVGALLLIALALAAIGVWRLRLE